MAPAVPVTARRAAVLATLVALAPAPAPAQTALSAGIHVGAAQSLLRANGAWRGPGITLSFHVPRTHNVDAGLEGGFFDLGTQEQVERDATSVFGPVVRTDRSEQQFGWAGLVARYHVTAGKVRPVLAAGVAIYGFNQLQTLEERTPGGALVRSGLFQVLDLEYTPGLSVGTDLHWDAGRHLLISARVRAHGAFTEGFPLVVLSAGVGYR